jgi:hypothetical protein
MMLTFLRCSLVLWRLAAADLRGMFSCSNITAHIKFILDAIQYGWERSASTSADPWRGGVLMAYPRDLARRMLGN